MHPLVKSKSFFFEQNQCPQDSFAFDERSINFKEKRTKIMDS